MIESELSDVVSKLGSFRSGRTTIFPLLGVFEKLIDETHSKYNLVEIKTSEQISRIKNEYIATLFLKYILDKRQPDNSTSHEQGQKDRAAHFTSGMRVFLYAVCSKMDKSLNVIKRDVVDSKYSVDFLKKLDELKNNFSVYSLEPYCGSVGVIGIATTIRDALKKEIKLDIIGQSIKEGAEYYSKTSGNAKKFKEYFAIRNKLLSLSKN